MVGEGVCYRFGHEERTREMDYSIDLIAFDQPLDECAIADIALDESCALGDCPTKSGR